MWCFFLGGGAYLVLILTQLILSDIVLVFHTVGVL